MTNKDFVFFIKSVHAYNYKCKFTLVWYICAPKNSFCIDSYAESVRAMSFIISMISNLRVMLV